MGQLDNDGRVTTFLNCQRNLPRAYGDTMSEECKRKILVVTIKLLLPSKSMEWPLDYQLGDMIAKTMKVLTS